MCEGKLEDENGRIEIRSVGEFPVLPADSPLVTALYKAYVDVTGDTENKPMVIGGGNIRKIHEKYHRLRSGDARHRLSDPQRG